MTTCSVAAAGSRDLQVLYVDFGNTETLPTTSLRADPILTDIPAQAFSCVLDGIRWVRTT